MQKFPGFIYQRDILFPNIFKKGEKYKKIIVKNVEINLTGIQDDDYWSLTDIAKFDNETDPRYPIQNWMRIKNTLLFLGVGKLK